VHRALIVPAAGAGSRLGGDMPKLLARVDGRPMIDTLLDLYRDHVETIVVVIHPSADDRVRAHLARERARVEVLWQPAPTGMLDAVLIPHALLAPLRPAQVWITWCDQVAVDPATIEDLARHADRAGVDAVIATAHRRHPYTCLERDSSGRLVRILHQREGDPIPEWGESEMGVFSLSDRTYFELLRDYAASAAVGAATQERNFLPFLPWAASRARVEMFRCRDAREAVGVNTPADLALVEAFLRQRQTERKSVPE
jgi:bifunctional UDP-N-acetylglucosamine pyrophosphorylase / glucosamine-1-phosphate N-acetyltransferase